MPLLELVKSSPLPVPRSTSLALTLTRKLFPVLALTWGPEELLKNSLDPAVAVAEPAVAPQLALRAAPMGMSVVVAEAPVIPAQVAPAPNNTGIAGYPVMYRTSLPADPLMPYQASGAVPSI